MSRLGFFALLFASSLGSLLGQNPASYQNRAATALQFETGQIGKDCRDAKNTLESNSCLSAVVEKTKSNFRVFYESLHSLLNPDPDAARQLETSQAQWEKYSTSACDAIDAFYRSGSIRASAVTACHIQLTRSRMHDLDVLYNTTLHH